LKPELLQLLCCPECHGNLSPRDLVVADGHWQSGTLDCACGQHFEIRDSIPRFVSDDAYAGNFSFEWTIHSKTQVDSRASSRSWDTFFEKTGLDPASLRGKRVLDVGVGSGRFADVASKCGAEVIGVDLSFSVDAARQTFRDRGNIHLVQANVFRLPFRPNTFDFIYSIGVLHHTPDCRRAFECLPPLLAPGGQIAIWVYASDLRKPSTVAKKIGAAESFRLARHRWAMAVSGAYRLVTVRINKRLLYFLCHVAVPYGALARVPLFGGLLKVILPMSSDAQPEWRVLDTFDWYSPRYQSKHTFEEVMQWFRASRLVDITPIEGWPVAVRGRLAASEKAQGSAA
jgi:SAM-dependent methyltransferase